jgi:Fe-S cluster assembly protein SufD
VALTEAPAADGAGASAAGGPGSRPPGSTSRRQPRSTASTRRGPADRGAALSPFTADAAARLGGPAWLRRRREDAWERFASATLPSETEEIWRYSGIDQFDLDWFDPVRPADPRAEHVALGRRLADRFGERAGLVVTVDGAVAAVEAAGGAWPAGVRAVALAGEPEPVDGLGALAGAEDAFGELHDALLADGAVVEVAPGTVVGPPIVVVHLAGAGPVAGARRPAAFPRTLVRVGERAQVAVVEVVAGAGPTAGLVVPVSELAVGDGGRLAHVLVQELDADAWQLAVSASQVGRDGELRSLVVTTGGHYARLRTDSAASGPGASSTLLAAFLGRGDQVLDFRTRQVHAAAHSSSELLFKGAVADRARSVYSGLIRIERGARGADARQTNHNLVLDEGARADSVPNLEIEENDVRCSHGSTVGPIDPEQRYYLESRGIEPAVAERLVVCGFFADLVGRSPVGPVGAWAEQHIAGRLAGSASASRGRARGGEGG